MEMVGRENASMFLDRSTAGDREEPTNREAPTSAEPKPIHRKSNRFRTRSLEAAAAGLALSSAAQPASAEIIWSTDQTSEPLSLVDPDGVLVAAVETICATGTMGEVSLGLEVLTVAAGMSGTAGMAGIEGMAESAYPRTFVRL